MSNHISIIVKASNEHRYIIAISNTETVLNLKKRLTLETDIALERIRLIYAGRVLKDADTLGSYNIEDGRTIHMVRSPNSSPSPLAAAPAATTVSSAATVSEAANPAGASSTSTPALGAFPNPWTNTLHRSVGSSGLGAYGGLGHLGNMSNMGDMDPTIMIQMMQDPNFAQYMSSMLQNPQIIESMLLLNPFLQSMGPEARQMLRSRQLQTMICSPDMLRQIAQMGLQTGEVGASEGSNGVGDMKGMSGQFSGVSHRTPVTRVAAAQSSEGLSTSESPTSTSSMVPATTDWSMFSPLMTLGGSRQSFRSEDRPTATSSTMADCWIRQQPVEERYQIELKKLNEMGFWDAAKNVRALVASEGNLNEAIELLFAGSLALDR
ncbi:hypothetical protein BGX28_001671 [Mortierella sp. GBA30]|nr:hypothetical protein BGX28_001671 [Mortierella sp. GBA30]